MNERNYILTETATDTENARLALLEELFDPLTIGRLNRLDISPGSRCLEVGAGIMTDAEHQRAHAVRSSPAVVMSTTSLVAAWGRRTN